MIKTTVKIEGMMCKMCEAHACEAIRKIIPDAKKVKASHKEASASFITEDEPDENKLKAAIEEMGYTFISLDSEPYEKKGLFGK
ncbi:MAG: cation transporter [Lachnospiraceae bacterium]|nr:cation transporter [Lachnospiraceae bacterium]